MSKLPASWWFAAFVGDEGSVILAHSQFLGGRQQAFKVYSPSGRCPLCDDTSAADLEQHIRSHFSEPVSLKILPNDLKTLPDALRPWRSKDMQAEIYLLADKDHFLRRVG